MKTCKELETFLDKDTRWSVINVYDENLSEMARVGRLPNSQLEIHIEGSEGNIPHFHLQKKNGKKENCICHIKLLVSEYLRDKTVPGNVLTTNESKALDEYMHKNASGLKVTNWEIILSKWNEMNPAHQQIINKENCPDYKVILEPKK